MDDLDKFDLETDLATNPAEKLRQTLELMATGLRLQRANIQRQNPEMDDTAIEEAFQRWLFADDER